MCLGHGLCGGEWYEVMKVLLYQLKHLDFMQYSQSQRRWVTHRDGMIYFSSKKIPFGLPLLEWYEGLHREA